MPSAGNSPQRATHGRPSQTREKGSAALSGAPAPAARKRRRPDRAHGLNRPQPCQAQQHSRAGISDSGMAGAGLLSTSGSASTTLRVADSDAESDFDIADSTPKQAGRPPSADAALCPVGLKASSSLPSNSVTCVRLGAVPASRAGGVGSSSPAPCLSAQPDLLARQPRNQPLQPPQHGIRSLPSVAAVEPPSAGMPSRHLVYSAPGCVAR